MKNLIKPMWTAQADWIEKHGDKVWEMICDAMPCGKWFTVKDCMGLAPSRSPRYQKTMILAVLRNVEAQGNGVVTRMGYSFMI